MCRCGVYHAFGIFSAILLLECYDIPAKMEAPPKQYPHTIDKAAFPSAAEVEEITPRYIANSLSPLQNNQQNPIGYFLDKKTERVGIYATYLCDLRRVEPAA